MFVFIAIGVEGLCDSRLSPDFLDWRMELFRPSAFWHNYTVRKGGL